MNRETARAARGAKAFVGSDKPINWQAVRAQEDALTTFKMPRLCPCCSFAWDQAAAEQAVFEGPDAYRRWLHETLSHPANEVGDQLGQRSPHPVTVEDFE